MSDGKTTEVLIYLPLPVHLPSFSLDCIPCCQKEEVEVRRREKYVFFSTYLARKLKNLHFKKPIHNAEIMTLDDAEGELSTIVKVMPRIREHEFDKYDSSAMRTIFANYINEIWLSEFPPPVQAHNTLEVVEHFMAGRDSEALRLLGEMVGGGRAERLLTKLKNVYAACQYLFGEDLRSHRQVTFDVNLAKKVHQLAGINVIANCGEFRTSPVSAAGSNAVYAMPSDIAVRLDALFDFVHQRRANIHGDDKTKSMILLGSLFFSEFLLIHPFSNGNGRTARLLLNYLLKDVTVVPFSLFYRNRQIYLDVLEDRSAQINEPPNTLAFYTLVCASRAVCDLAFLLSIDPDLESSSGGCSDASHAPAI